MEFVYDQNAGDIMKNLHRQQQRSPNLCDVKLRVEDDIIKAHGCILAACSDYFKTLLTGDFEDCQAMDYQIPISTPKTVSKVIEFMYTGRIVVTLDDVEDILAAADYFCMDRLKTYCTSYLRDNVNEENCLYVKMVADKYSLVDLGRDAIKFISPRFSNLLHCPEALELPAEFVITLLKDSKFNYIREQDIFEFITKWINFDQPEREKYFGKMFLCVELSYLPRTFLRRCLTEEKLVSEKLGEDLLKVIRETLRDDGGRSTEDIIVCRSRSVSQGEEVQLMCYVIFEDKWVSLKGPEPHIFDGLESMLHHMDSLYLLVSKVEDMYGYMHNTEEKKYFWRFNLKAGVWEHLPPPKTARGICRLVSHVNGIYVVDRGGVIEEYNCDTNDWMVSCQTPLFDYPSATWYVLPMPVDRYIYLLRAYSAGYSFTYSQLRFKLYKFDTVTRTCENLSDIESGEIDMEEHERLHGYTARPGKLTLKNELGESRLRFHFQDRSWSTRKPRIRLPKFVAEVWGATEWNDRVFFVSKTKHGKTAFMMYDYARGRFKGTLDPPGEISGLTCHVVMSRSTLNRLVLDLGDSTDSDSSDMSDSA